MANNYVKLDADAHRLKRALTEEARRHLMENRHVKDEVIDIFDLGSHGERISLPIRSIDGEVSDVRLYLPKHLRPAKRSQKILPLKGGDGSTKLYPIEVAQVLALNECRRSGEEPSYEILENLDRLEKLRSLIRDFSFVLLVEGEMDALAAISQGFLAITNTCGANSWNDSFSETLAALKIPIVICMDADNAGVEGAQKRAESLYSHGVDVRVVEWSDSVPEGHDITDELSSRGLTGLMAVVASARPYRDVISLDEVMAENIDWLYEPYIAVGKVTLVEGDPGIGKTYFVLVVAAAVTVGGRGLPGDQEVTSGPVLLMSAEDGLGDTIKPRLETRDAELSKILAPKELFTLDDKGFKNLEELIRRHGPRLVVIDPIMPFLSAKTDSNKATDMRPFFKNLSRLAQKYKCAVLVTRHLAKSKEQTGVSRGLGSIDISAAVRSILQVTVDSEVSGLKRISHIKSNIGMKGKALGFRTDGGSFSWVQDLPAVQTCEVNSEIDRACDFLKEALSEGPLDALEVSDQARILGLSKSTLNRAKAKVGVRSKRVTHDGKLVVWKWYLPGYQWQTGKSEQVDQDFQENLPFTSET